MGTLVTYQLRDAVATITMDDRKVNALSLPMLTELGAALDRAAADRAVVVLTGREGIFSAGFDLPVLRAGGTQAADLLRRREVSFQQRGRKSAHRDVVKPVARLITRQHRGDGPCSRWRRPDRRWRRA